MSGLVLPGIRKVRDEPLMIRCGEPEFEDMTRRIQLGDPIIGWRGDEHAELWRREGVDGRTTFFVMMTDVKNDRYVGPALDPGEPLTPRILAKLRDTDWQHGRGSALIAQQRAEQIKAEEYRKQKVREQVHEDVVPRLWNIARTGRA